MSLQRVGYFCRHFNLLDLDLGPDRGGAGVVIAVLILIVIATLVATRRKR